MRAWRTVTASYRKLVSTTDPKLRAYVWACALSCEHETWRAVKVHPRAPRRLVCWQCERWPTRAERERLLAY